MIMIVVMIVIFLVLVRVSNWFILTAIFGIALGKIVVMKMKEALQKEHCQKSPEHPCNGPVKRTQLLTGIWQKMQQRDAKHQACDEADRGLQSSMGQLNDNGQPTTKERSQQDKRTIYHQQPTGRNHDASHNPSGC